MEVTLHNMAVARELQEIVLAYAKEQIKKFPPVVVAKKPNKVPLGVG